METINNSTRKTIKIAALVLLGLFITFDLAFIYYQANFNDLALPSFCSISDFIDCDGVARTTESQFLGVPLAYWGVFLYSFILMLLAVDKLKEVKYLKFLEVFKNKFHYIASLGIISFCISMILLCVSLFEIQKLCIMCAITYMINLCIGIVALENLEGGLFGAFKQSWKDFVEALKPIQYRTAFIVVMILAGGFLAWTDISATFSPALKTQRGYGEFLKAKTNKYAITGNVLGSDAKDAVVIGIYSDYMCPMCNVFNMMLHKMVREFDNVRVEHHSMPLDTDCNKFMTQEFHHGSCTMAKYAEAAQLQGKFWEVNSLFFEKKPATEEEVISVLENSGFGLDMDKLKKDAKSAAVNQVIQDDINTAVYNNQIGTPTIHIGNKFEMGIPKGGYPALKQMVIENGGKLKHKMF
jgi:protein-disulfide isomerase